MGVLGSRLFAPAGRSRAAVRVLTATAAGAAGVKTAMQILFSSTGHRAAAPSCPEPTRAESFEASPPAIPDTDQQPDEDRVPDVDRAPDVDRTSEEDRAPKDYQYMCKIVWSDKPKLLAGDLEDVEVVEGVSSGGWELIDVIVPFAQMKLLDRGGYPGNTRKLIAYFRRPIERENNEQAGC